MTAVAYKSSILSSYNKMDNVLYEIRDEKGIPKNRRYEAWKEEVLRDLLKAGFIKLQEDLYTISEEGREVIQQDSFLYYNKRTKINKSASVDENLEEKSSLISNFWIWLIRGSILGVALLWFLMNSGVVF
jgi:DNA-binding PadR family transcriptional regulator